MIRKMGFIKEICLFFGVFFQVSSPFSNYSHNPSQSYGMGKVHIDSKVEIIEDQAQAMERECFWSPRLEKNFLEHYSTTR